MRLITWIAVALVIAIPMVAVACGEGDVTRQDTGWHAITVPAPDGRPVVCITNDLGDGISCDWDHR